MDKTGAIVGDSGNVVSKAPQLRVDVLLRSRASYKWRVRIADADGHWSPWSTWAFWETPLLDDSDWQAKWVSRWTPRETRVTASIHSDTVDWMEAGSILEQSFQATGPVTAVSVDLDGDIPSDVIARMQLRNSAGDVVAQRELDGSWNIWARFMCYLEVRTPAPPGTYTLSITCEQGRLGWRRATTAASLPDDDGVMPLPVRGEATVDGVSIPGVRTLAVETLPAPNPVLRTSFTIPAGVTSARLYAVGVGYGAFSINGRSLGNELEPATTDFTKTVLYRTYDVTADLNAGENTLVVELGRGFFSARGASIWGWHIAPWSREPMAIAQLEYLDQDGQRQVVSSGPHWEASIGQVVSELLYSGEVWQMQAKEKSVWEPAVLVNPPAGTLRPAALPPVRLGSAKPPASMHYAGTARVYDFAEMVAGRVRCTLSVPGATEVRVKYGETLDDDGAVYCENLFAAGPIQTDRLLFDSSADRICWEPKFSYKGYRYVSIEAAEPVTVHDIFSIPMHTDVQTLGAFECSEETLNWLDRALAKTFLNNLHGIPTDTPVYEKNGWTADAHLTAEALIHQFDLKTTFGKWLDDHADAQDDAGVVSNIVPTPGWGRAPDPAWSASAVLIPWNLYWEYGDLKLLERHHEMVIRYADAMYALSEEGIWSHPSYGDWLAPGHERAPEGSAPTATMMLMKVLSTAADISTALGEHRIAARFSEQSSLVGAAYHRSFFNEDLGSYGNKAFGYRQTMNVLPLAFGAVPQQHRTTVFRSLAADILERTAGHLDCGAVGAKYLLPVLSKGGRDDIAVSVATQNTRPGWGVWREAGETTLLESWDTSARSHNHYFLGSAAAWVQQKVGGIRSTRPGWEEFTVAPLADPRISRGALSHLTPRGQAAISWTREAGTWHLDVTVPWGASATIGIGTAAGTKLSGGFHRLEFEDAPPAIPSHLSERPTDQFAKRSLDLRGPNFPTSPTKDKRH
nr:family 78 glycoside hydrolase catalytic domain [Arthrobacter rhizosphaerae]